MAAGARLDEDELAGQLEVDPPVVREALCRLERDGFVRPEDGGSFAVAPLSEIEVREGYPVVILLEGLAVSYILQSFQNLNAAMRVDLPRSASSTMQASSRTASPSSCCASACSSSSWRGGRARDS